MSNPTASAIANITEVVTRVTRILSNKSIQVIQQGMKVGVEYDAEGAPSKVYLPSLSENPSPELVTAIQGFLDKEVSTLLFTDHKTQKRLGGEQQFKKGMGKALQEIIEDARTERMMRQEFRGSAANFNKNHDFAIREIIQPKHDTLLDPAKRTANLALPAVRSIFGQPEYEEFMDDKWEQLGKLGGALLHYAKEIESVESTEDSFNLTRKIIRKMEETESDDDGDGDEDSDKSKDKKQDGGGACAQGGGSGSPSENDGEGDGEQEKPENGDGKAESGEGDDGEQQSASPQPGNEGGEPGDSPPSPKQERVDLSKDNKSNKLHKPQKKRPSGMSGGSQGLEQFQDYEAAFDEQNFDTALYDKIKDIAGLDATASGAYTPYSRQYDYVGPLPCARESLNRYPSNKHAQELIDAAQKKSHVIQQQVQKLFMAKSLVRWEPGQKRGKINPTALYKLSQGDPRIFRRRIESNSRDVAVSLLIDMSGSMASCAKIQNACIAALMFSQVLTALNIAHEISAFSTYSGYGTGMRHVDTHAVNEMMREAQAARGGYYGGPSPDKHNGKLIQYARVVPICNYIIKGYDERLTEEIKRITASIPSTSCGLMSGNVDGECVDLAGRRLLHRKETKKVMIVMSDGCPAADGFGADLVQHLKDVVKQLSAAGVEMLGLGLQDHSVKKFYPKNEIVQSSEEIPGKILELTRQMVVGV